MTQDIFTAEYDLAGAGQSDRRLATPDDDFPFSGELDALTRVLDRDALRWHAGRAKNNSYDDRFRRVTRFEQERHLAPDVIRAEQSGRTCDDRVIVSIPGEIHEWRAIVAEAKECAQHQAVGPPSSI